MDKTCTECSASEKGCLIGEDSSHSGQGDGDDNDHWTTETSYEGPVEAAENGDPVEAEGMLKEEENELLRAGKGWNHF